MTRSPRDATPADPLQRAADLALTFLASLPTRPVGPPVDLTALRAALGGPLPVHGEDAHAVVEQLARAADAGIVASAGPRYFGFVVGGGTPEALAAEWLASAWDQNACLYVMSPAAAVVEEVVGTWFIELFGLPAETSVGFTTGATMATFTALAAARHAVLRARGWDVEERGLIGAPTVDMVASDETHVTVFAALQMLGLGRGPVRRVAVDAQGRMRPEALRRTLAGAAPPAIVCAQAGNVNTGAFDPLEDVAAAVREHGGWLHVDGAFGMWAAAAPELRRHVAGLALADSWTTDAHKYLNVPYDSGLVFVRDADAHYAAMTLGAAYYVESSGTERDCYNWVPESSRRARGFPIYAALRALGRDGLAALVTRCARLARRMAEILAIAPGARVLNDVVLNQVLVGFTPPTGHDADAYTRDVIARVQADGTCWVGGTVWQGHAAMRISVSGWSTTDQDIERSAQAIVRAATSAARSARC